MNIVIAAVDSTTSMTNAINSLIGLVPVVLNMIMDHPVLAIFFCASIIGTVIEIVRQLK